MPELHPFCAEKVTTLLGGDYDTTPQADDPITAQLNRLLHRRAEAVAEAEAELEKLLENAHRALRTRCHPAQEADIHDLADTADLAFAALARRDEAQAAFSAICAAIASIHRHRSTPSSDTQKQS